MESPSERQEISAPSSPFPPQSASTPFSQKPVTSRASPGIYCGETLLASEGGDAIKSAAAAAASGDQDQARVLLSSLLSSPEGAQLTAKIIEVINN